jgi:hypothetical protein
MKILLIIVYASLHPIPDQSRVTFSTHEFQDKQKCHEVARRMVERARAGQLRAFCLKVKDKP